MTDPAHAVQRAFFMAPSWLGHDDGQCLAFVEMPGAEVIELRGTLRSNFLDGVASPASRAMARFNPGIERLFTHREQNALAPLDRAALMRGSGFGQLFVELTAQCNERCAHCYADSSPQRKEALDKVSVRAVLEDARELDFQLVQFTGGDPLVSDLCLPAVAYAFELGIPSVEIYTNGIALYGTLYERLKAHPVSFAFSFYSHDAAIHDAITATRGSHKRTLDAIARTIKDGIRTRVNVVVMEQNRSGVAQTFEMLRGLGVPDGSIGMDVQRSVGRGEMTIEPGAEDLPSAPGGELGGHRGPDHETFAGRAAVSYDGIVFPCIFTRSFPLGDVRKQRLSTILLAREALAVDRQRVLAGSALRSSEFACWDCRQRAALLREDTLIPLRQRKAT